MDDDEIRAIVNHVLDRLHSETIDPGVLADIAYRTAFEHARRAGLSDERAGALAEKARQETLSGAIERRKSPRRKRDRRTA